VFIPAGFFSRFEQKGKKKSGVLPPSRSKVSIDIWIMKSVVIVVRAGGQQPSNYIVWPTNWDQCGQLIGASGTWWLWPRSRNEQKIEEEFSAFLMRI